jgi:tetratricopeptide (TPR) repeat protein
MTHYTKTKYPRARIALAVVLAASVLSCSSYYNFRGVYRANKLDYQAALAFYLKALEGSPDNATYNGNAGGVLLRLKQFDQAIPYLVAATRLKPDKYHYLAFTNLGWCHLHKKEYATAVSFFKKSLELKPDFTYTLSGIGAAYLANKDYELARQKLQEAETGQPDTPFIWMQLGWANYYLGDMGKAKLYFQKFLDKDRDNDQARFGLGLAYLRSGDPGRGEQYLGGLGSMGFEARKTDRGEGVEISRVYPGLPADRAGLDEGDIVLRINNSKVTDPAQLSKLIRSLKPGSVVPVAYLRYGSLQQENITVGTILDNPHFQPEIPR